MATNRFHSCNLKPISRVLRAASPEPPELGAEMLCSYTRRQCSAQTGNVNPSLSSCYQQRAHPSRQSSTAYARQESSAFCPLPVLCFVGGGLELLKPIYWTFADIRGGVGDYCIKRILTCNPENSYLSVSKATYSGIFLSIYSMHGIKKITLGKTAILLFKLLVTSLQNQDSCIVERFHP